jgi:hypothetical protein
MSDLTGRPDIDVNIVGPIIAVVAQNVPAWVVAPEPGLVPAGVLVAEVPDLRRAVISLISAHGPLKRPIDSRPADFGPQRQPFSAIHPRNCAEPAGIRLDKIFIASAGRRGGVNGLIALRSITVRRGEAA